MDLHFDVKEKIEEVVTKLQKDAALRGLFEKDPIQALEKLLGVDLPDEKLQPIISGVKAKLAASQTGDALDVLKKLF